MGSRNGKRNGRAKNGQRGRRGRENNLKRKKKEKISIRDFQETEKNEFLSKEQIF